MSNHESDQTEIVVDTQPSISVSYRAANEQLRTGLVSVGATVGDFWAWSGSDLVANTTRGLLAEFIVGLALGAVNEPRREWATWDVTTSDGVTVEVKSSAYVKGWEQKKPSTIRFGIAKTVSWDLGVGYGASAPRRHADIYVFALLAELDRTRLDPLDLDQWEFYVVATSELDSHFPNAKSISLANVIKRGTLTKFGELRSMVFRLATTT